jgi:hypothetical protein
VDETTLASWHDFYLTMGTASASLIGLLFVALSLHIDAITGDARDDLRAFADQAFSSFTIVLLIAVFFLIPDDGAETLGSLYIVLSFFAAYRMLRRAPAVWRSRARGRPGEATIWRFVLPTAAVVGLFAVGLGLLLGQRSALYWLVAVIIGLLMSAARSSWDLLIKVGTERRAAKVDA